MPWAVKLWSGRLKEVLGGVKQVGDINFRGIIWGVPRLRYFLSAFQDGTGCQSDRRFVIWLYIFIASWSSPTENHRILIDRGSYPHLWNQFVLLTRCFPMTDNFFVLNFIYKILKVDSLACLGRYFAVVLDKLRPFCQLYQWNRADLSHVIVIILIIGCQVGSPRN